jgi:PPP family 3-phenylpropionic acid transporter
MLGEHREEYGRYRLGGSIGYIIATFSAGYLFQGVGLGMLFPLYGAVMLAFALIAPLLPSLVVHHKEPGTREIATMIRQPAWMILVICLFLSWIASNASIMFLGVSLSAMGAGTGLIGLVSTLTAIFELPFMFYSGAFLRRFGPVRLLIFAMICQGLRLFLFGRMTDPNWALAINLLNGPGYVFLWNSAITYANRLAPPGRAGTAQSLITATMNLASVASGLVSGWLFDALGISGIYTVMGFVYVLSLVIFTGGNFFISKREPILET